MRAGALALACCFSGAAAAAPLPALRDQTGPLGLAQPALGAFDGPEAFLDNPATIGLFRGRVTSLSAFGAGASDLRDAWSGTTTLAGNWWELVAAAARFSRFRTGKTLGDAATLALATPTGGGLSVGASVTWLRQTGPLSSSGLLFDAGFVYQVAGALSVGVSGRNTFAADLGGSAPAQLVLSVMSGASDSALRFSGQLRRSFPQDADPWNDLALGVLGRFGVVELSGGVSGDRVLGGTGASLGLGLLTALGALRVAYRHPFSDGGSYALGAGLECALP